MDTVTLVNLIYLGVGFILGSVAGQLVNYARAISQRTTHIEQVVEHIEEGMGPDDA